MSSGKSSLPDLIVATTGLAIIGLCCVAYFLNGAHGRAPPGAPTQWVFFLGNSYTLFNDLPHMVAAIAASDKENPVNIQTAMAVIGNSTLDDLWRDGGVQSLFRARHFDWIVLQEHSMQTLIPAWIPLMKRGMTNWVNLARQTHTRPIVYETWARRPGSDWYNPAEFPNSGMADPEQMQRQIDDVTNSIAAQLNAPVVPVGDYWASCRSRKDVPELYRADASHPTTAGTYLTALLLYRYLTKHNVANVTYTPSDITSEDADFLKKCAEEKER